MFVYVHFSKMVSWFICCISWWGKNIISLLLYWIPGHITWFPWCCTLHCYIDRSHNKKTIMSVTDETSREFWHLGPMRPKHLRCIKIIKSAGTPLLVKHIYFLLDLCMTIQRCVRYEVRNKHDMFLRFHSIAGGYGRVMFGVMRKGLSCLPFLQPDVPSEFPLTLGRDFSGVVVETGKNVRKFRVGDEVFTENSCFSHVVC